MVVWKRHGTEPSAVEIDHMMQQLTSAAQERFGGTGFRIDRQMRQMPTHFHAHARDGEWLTRRWTDPPSRYTGVGGPRTTSAELGR